MVEIGYNVDNSDFAEYCRNIGGCKFNISPIQFNEIRDKLDKKLKDCKSKCFVEMEAKPYYTIYGKRYELENVLQDIWEEQYGNKNEI